MRMDGITTDPFRLSDQLAHGRIVNALAAMFRETLHQPHIFLNPELPDITGLDVLAADWSGSGDLHGVEIKLFPFLPTETMMRREVETLLSLPVNYKYLAVACTSDDVETLGKMREYVSLFDSAGIGRIGVLGFDEALLRSSADATATAIWPVLAPERFLIRGERLGLIEGYLEQTRPDVFVRF